MNRSAHFSRARQCGGADQARIENRDGDWSVCFKAVMVVRERKGRTWPKGRCHSPEHFRQTFREVFETALHVGVAGQFALVPCCDLSKMCRGFRREPLQPD